jgi:hypothetical protein
MLDGKLLLVTNMADHSPMQIVERYKALADIERGFRVLKSEIEIAPVFHRRADRIRAHALICFLALVLYRVLRLRPPRLARVPVLRFEAQRPPPDPRSAYRSPRAEPFLPLPEP